MLKVIKNCICLGAVICLLLSINLGISVVYAQEGWECTSLPADSSLSEADDENINMYFQTDNSEGKAHAQKTFDFSSNESICISFKMQFEGSASDIIRRLNLQNSSLTTTELLRITGADIEIFGTEVQTLEENREYRVEIGIRKEDGEAVVWLDSEQVYSGALGNKWKKFDYSSLDVLFRNATVNKISSVQSEWLISELVISDTVNDFTTTPENGEEYVESSKTSIDVTYNGQKQPAVFAKENYVLSMDGEDIDFDVERNGRTLKITPAGGMLPDKEYILTILEMTDIFGNVEETESAIRFTTADEAYVKAKLEITSSAYEIYDNENVTISIVTQTQNEITSSTIYVNNEIYTTYDSEAKNFIFEAESGKYEIYAESIDIFGGKTVSDTIVINILHNDIPVIEIGTIADGMEFDADRLKEVSIKATDSDGTVEKIELYVNDELFTTISGSESVVDLSTLEYGIYRIKIIAVDNVGASTESEMTITVLKGYNSSRIFSSDFNKYASDGTTNPGLSFVLTGDAKLIASKDYGEEHGTVVLMKSEGQLVDGVSAHGSWGRFPTSSTADGFRIMMDVNIENDKGLFYFMLKHPSQSILCADVKINQGLLTLADNGTDKVKITITPGEWYSIDYKVDIKKHTYSFSLNGELLADEFGMGNKKIDKIDTRFTMDFPNNTPVDCGIAFDNLVIDNIAPMPQITAIGYDDTNQCVKVSPEANTLKITLNTDVLPATLNRSSVLLYCEGEMVNYEGIEYDSEEKIVTIILSEKLRSNHSYTIHMTDKVATAAGVLIADGMDGGFVTDFNTVDVSMIEIKKDIDSACISGTIVNSTGEADEVYVIINVFDGTRLSEVNIEKIKVNSSLQTVFETTPTKITEGETIQVYVWNSLINPSPILSRTCVFN